VTAQELINFHQRALEKLNSVVSEDGVIFASEDKRFHHKFARDTFKSAHLIFQGLKYRPDPDLFKKTKKAVFEFWQHQILNGQIPHEIRPFDEIFAKTGFYKKKGNYLVNDDSVDATALALIVTPLFIENEEELNFFIPRAKLAISWMIGNMRANGGFLRYRYNYQNGGLTNHGWMDSTHSIKWRKDRLPKDPIALVEVQAYAWNALSLWSDLLLQNDPRLSLLLKAEASLLKKRFNRKFLFKDEGGYYFATAIDGLNRRIRSVSLNPGLCLWASHKGATILNKKLMGEVLKRLLSDELFDERAGIRTFGINEPVFDPEEYHSGKNIFWPFTSYMIAEGLLRLGFEKEAEKIMIAPRTLIKHFDSFIELCKKHDEENFTLFKNGGESGSCKNQTWTIAGFFWESSHSLYKDNPTF
jgi:glycogen debranching enzyme